MLTPVKSRRYTDHIVEQLKEYIIERQLTAGQQLPSDAELSQTFDVSRGTIREALHILEHDGVIEIKKGPGGGIFVGKGNLSQVVESIFYTLRWEQISFESLMETRKLLEDRVARLAAMRATKENIEEIRVILGKMEKAKGDPAMFVRYDTDFHVSLARAAKNKILLIFMTAVKELHNRLLEYEELPDDLFAVAIQFHRHILEAVKNRDSQKAADAMVAHLEYFQKRYRKTT